MLHSLYIYALFFMTRQRIKDLRAPLVFHNLISLTLRLPHYIIQSKNKLNHQLSSHCFDEDVYIESLVACD